MRTISIATSSACVSRSAYCWSRDRDPAGDHDDPLAARGAGRDGQRRRRAVAACVGVRGGVPRCRARRLDGRGSRIVEREINAKSTLIIGAGKIGHLVANRLLEHPEFGLRPIGFLDKEPLDHAESPVPILGASWDLEQVIEEHGVDHVVVAFSTAPSDVLLRQMKRCEEAGIGISLVPRLYEYMTDRATIEHIGGLPLVSPRRIRAQGWQFTVKYAVDRAVAATLLVLLSPLLAILAVGVALSVGWPVLFRQTRVGLGGREFDLQVQDDDAHADGSTADHGRADDECRAGGRRGSDRRTRFGSIIRRLSLDELPQLINVLKGDMSLSGRGPSGRNSSRSSSARSPATTTATASSRASPAGRRSMGSGGRLPSPTASSGTTTISRTGRFGSTSRSWSPRCSSLDSTASRLSRAGPTGRRQAQT